MKFANGVSFLLLLATGVVLPATLAAQSKQASPPAAAPLLTEQQRSGEGLFRQNCPLCHIPVKKIKKDPNEKGTYRGASLEGLFRGGKVKEEVVRQIILQGIPGKMPGFQYTLEPKEMDDVIAYLKTL